MKKCLYFQVPNCRGEGEVLNEKGGWVKGWVGWGGGVGNSQGVVGGGGGGDVFKILLLLYLEIQRAFQIIKTRMVSFELLCLILYLNTYVSYVTVFINDQDGLFKMFLKGIVLTL